METQTPTFIRVLKQPAQYPSVRTATGLYGWLCSAVQIDGTVDADLIGFHENVQDINVWSTVLTPGEYQIVKPTRRLKQAYALHAMPRDKAATTVAKTDLSPKTVAKGQFEVLKASRENPFLIKTLHSKFDKGDYVCYTDMERNGTIKAQREAACKEKLTDEDRLVLYFANQALDAVSSWSGDETVRALVHELDLDPFISKFNNAVYNKEARTCIPRNQLRVHIIQALNRGLLILDIHDGNLNKAGRESYPDSNEPVTHFFVTTAQRRKLPAIA